MKKLQCETCGRHLLIAEAQQGTDCTWCFARKHLCSPIHAFMEAFSSRRAGYNYQASVYEQVGRELACKKDLKAERIG